MSNRNFRNTRKKVRRLLSGVMAGLMTVGTITVAVPDMVYAAENDNGWREENGTSYWYENGVRQGVKYNADGSIDTGYRGKEIYDPSSDAWYWLDAVDGGKMTVSKDVYQESDAGEWGDNVNEAGEKTGKWVRYDANGHMVKGWDEKEGKRYYFDPVYGTMAKGDADIDGVHYYFNKDTGILESSVAADDDGKDLYVDGWHRVGGVNCWYENGVRQGYKTNDDGSIDESYRGKEIYDPGSDAWYWLDNVQQGAVAKNKDVYQESDAGNWADRADGTGKWVRYDEAGHMVKGWNSNDNGTYYFDPVYGSMAKGYAVIDAELHYFDTATGIEHPTVWDGLNGWVIYDNIYGNAYWYENGVRQGVKYNADGSIDTDYRGKEIYDPDSDAWYWLDCVDNGKKAISKDVYQESFAGDWGERTDEQGQRIGKWVRYDERGHMVKGWSTDANGTYYFDLIYGTMAKGVVTIDGKKYEFDSVTGTLIKEIQDDSGNTGNDDVNSREYTDAVVEELIELKDYHVEAGSDSEGELVLPYNDYTADLKKDDILVLPANDTWSDGLILKVTDSYVENGEIKVSGEVPTDPLEVYDSVDIEYTATVDSSYFTPAEGVTYRVIEPDVQQYMNGSIERKKLSKKHEFEIEELNTKVTVCITQVDVDIEYSKNGIENLDIRMPIDIDINTSLTNSEIDFKKELGSIPIKLPAGFSVEIGLYLVGSVEGELSIEVDIDSVVGVTYADGKFAPASECTSNDTVVLSADAKLGSGVEVGVYFAKDILDAWNKFKEAFGDKADANKEVKPIVNVSAESGEKVDTKLESHSDASLVCVDATGYLYMTILFADDCILDDLLDIDREWEVIDSDNSPKKINVHIESKSNEGFKKVDKCTYSSTALLSKCTVTLSQSICQWDGTAKAPSVTVKNGDSVVPESEYTVSYANNTDVGTAKVIVTANSTSKVVKGSTSKSFTIFDGPCGSVEDIQWTISNRKLTVTGKCGENGQIPTNAWEQYKDSITSARIEVSGAKSLRDLFAGYSNLESVDLSKLDTSKVTSMYGMFYECGSLTSLDVSGFDTGSVTNMSGMFAGCSSLTSLDVSGFKTKSVTNMVYMFSGCSSLTSLDVSGFDTGSVTDMSGMFNGCSSLTSLDVRGFDFDTGSVTNMSGMFYGCSSLTSLDVRGFDTGSVTDMSSMFYGCSSLTSLDVRGFDTENVMIIFSMFGGCSSLTSLDLSGFDTGNALTMTGMFYGCENLTEILVGPGWVECGLVISMFEGCGTDHVTVKP